VRNLLLAVVVNINLFVLIPRLALQKKWMAYSLFLLLDFAFYVIAKNVHDVYLNGYVLGDPEKQHFFYHTFYNFSIAIFYMAFGVALQLSREWYTQREFIRKMEIEKLNAELEYLKGQINPHFLFNSINTIYFQIDKHNTTARETLAAFSDMLRYQLYECGGNEISIEKEIAYLKNYVDLQRHRKDNNYQIDFSCRDMRGFTIAPLLLIPFVENAFKHVSHFRAVNEVKIDIRKIDNTFRLSVFNTKDDVENDKKNEHRGIGLRNVQRRLELLYKDRHSLCMHNLPATFEVNLELIIN
jgi:two-component system LytT family sensor kinase